MKAVTRLGIGLVVFTMALGLLALPAQAKGISLQDFIDNVCGTTIGPNESVQVEEEGANETIIGDCKVTLKENSDLEFGKKITFEVTGKFTLNGGGEDDVEIQFGEENVITTQGIDWSVGEDGEIQVKKNTDITANSDIVMTANGDDGEIQFEENTCLDARLGKIELKANGEDSEVQIKKAKDDKDPCGTMSTRQPNILADKDITISANGEDGEVQIEEDNSVFSDQGKISLSANGADGEVQTKKFVKLDADSDISLTATGPDGEVQAEENSDFDSGTKIILQSNSTDGETEIKKDSDLDAGTIEVKGASIKCESPVAFSVPRSLTFITNDGC